MAFFRSSNGGGGSEKRFTQSLTLSDDNWHSFDCGFEPKYVIIFWYVTNYAGTKGNTFRWDVKANKAYQYNDNYYGNESNIIGSYVSKSGTQISFKRLNQYYTSPYVEVYG